MIMLSVLSQRVLEERGGNEGNMDDVMEMIRFRARDNSRTPIQVSYCENIAQSFVKRTDMSLVG
jgi:hypothetical protein